MLETRLHPCNVKSAPWMIGRSTIFAELSDAGLKEILKTVNVIVRSDMRSIVFTIAHGASCHITVKVHPVSHVTSETALCLLSTPKIMFVILEKCMALGI